MHVNTQLFKCFLITFLTPSYLNIKLDTLTMAITSFPSTFYLAECQVYTWSSFSQIFNKPLSWSFIFVQSNILRGASFWKQRSKLAENRSNSRDASHSWTRYCERLKFQLTRSSWCDERTCSWKYMSEW